MIGPNAAHVNTPSYALLERMPQADRQMTPHVLQPLQGTHQPNDTSCRAMRTALAAQQVCTRPHGRKGSPASCRLGYM
jgi:hypothetical protein